jgi:general secretion pathway protein G
MKKLFIKSKGFSLVELLVVISIIGLLMGIIIPNLNNAKANGRDARRVSDIKNIQLALALYYNDNLHYPCSLSSTGMIGSCAPDFWPTYMATVPKDPKTLSEYIYVAQQNTSATDNLTCNNKPVVYYHLGAIMESADSSLLNQDDDKTQTQQIGYACSQSNGGARFDGNAASCSGSTGVSAPGATPDPCYDVVPPS